MAKPEPQTEETQATENRLVRYELLLIFKPTFDSDPIDESLATLDKVITNLDGKVLRSDKVGRKKLAYKIGQLKEASMAVMAIDLPPSNVTKLSRTLKLNEDLLRYTILKHTELDLEKAPVVTPVTGREPRDSRGRGGRRPQRDDRRGGGERGDRSNAPERADAVPKG